MFCANCGAEVSKDTKFCSACGHEISSSEKIENATSAIAAAASPAKKKMALWKKIVLGVVGFIVFIVGLAMFLTAPLVEPIDKQLAALQNGNIDVAYSLTSKAFQKATSKEQFAAFIKGNPALMQVTDHTFTNKEWENNIGTVKGTLKTKDGGVLPVEYKLVKEDDEWKILNIKLQPQGASN